MMTAVEIAATAVSGPDKVQERLHVIAAASASRSAPPVARVVHPLARHRLVTIVRRKATANASSAPRPGAAPTRRSWWSTTKRRSVNW
jgi:hypothetical protein